MPELPEVETIKNDLCREVEGALIKDVVVCGEYRVHPSNGEFIQEVRGRRIVRVERIAKTIHLHLLPEGSERIIFHLAMTGRILLRDPQHSKDSHTRVSFHLGNGKEIRFTDLRMFGYVKLLDKNEAQKFLEKYGKDPFEISEDEFAERIRQRRTSIKNALLDQPLVSGIGNIYANDALWMAKIHPAEQVNQLTSDRLIKLYKNVKEILAEGIEHRGSTLKDGMYVDLYGKTGHHQNYFRIYGKAGEPCPRCREPIKFKKLNGRGTFFCPKCQG